MCFEGKIWAMRKNIFKKILAGVSLVAMLGSLTACNTKIKVEYEYDASQYVTLGEYKGIEVSIDRAAIEEQVINDKIEEDILTYTEYTEVKREAMEEDRVTVTFTGTIGGSTVDGFSGENNTYTLGTDTFVIDGFMDALYGMKSGEEKIVTLTIPEDFEQNTEYAGKKIVYEITMSKVEQVTTPMLTDAFVKDAFNIDTVTEYKETLKKNLASTIDSRVADKKKELVLLKLQETATISGYPEEFLQKKTEEYDKTISFYAMMQGYTNDQYCQKNYGVNFDEYVKRSVVQDAIIQLVIKQEKLYITEYEYKDQIEPFALEQGFSNKDSMLEKYGKNDVVKTMLYKKAQNIVIDSAVVK